MPLSSGRIPPSRCSQFLPGGGGEEVEDHFSRAPPLRYRSTKWYSVRIEEKKGEHSEQMDGILPKPPSNTAHCRSMLLRSFLS